MSVGCPCFFCWGWLFGVVFITLVNWHHVVSENGNRILEVKCTGDSIPRPDMMHHLTGCALSWNYSEDRTTIKYMIGEFTWEPGRPCGKETEKIEQGKFLAGTPLSFLGNASDGVLKPWHVNNARVCDFVEGESSAPVMLQNHKIRTTMGACILLIVCLISLAYASCCLFFPDRSSDRSDVSSRAFVISLIASALSCLYSAFGYMYGDSGHFIALVIIFIIVWFGFDGDLKRVLGIPEDSRYDHPVMSAERRAELAAQDPTEDEPLLPNSASQTPVYTNEQAQSDNPVEPVAGTTSGGEPEREESFANGSESTKGSSMELLMAIALGIAIVIVVTVFLVILTS